MSKQPSVDGQAGTQGAAAQLDTRAPNDLPPEYAGLARPTLPFFFPAYINPDRAFNQGAVFLSIGGILLFLLIVAGATFAANPVDMALVGLIVLGLAGTGIHRLQQVGSARQIRDRLKQEGVVTDGVVFDRWSLPGWRYSGTRHMAAYAFSVADPTTKLNQTYTQAYGDLCFYDWSRGRLVRARYLPDDPNINCIQFDENP